MGFGYVLTSLSHRSRGFARVTRGAHPSTGAIVCFSLAAASAAKAAPASTAKIWRELYARGAVIMPKVASVVALSFAYAAYDVSARGGRWTGFAAAAAAVVSIVPFSLTYMSGNIAALQRAAADAPDGPATADVPDLIDTWCLMNLARGLFPLVGTVLGVSAFLDNAWVK